VKVLHVETGRHLYGGAKQVYYLIEGLQSKGIENILVCPKDSGIARVAGNLVSKLYSVKMRGDLDVLFIWTLYKIMVNERPDIIHLHSRRGADLLGGIAAKLYKKAKIVLTRRVDNPEPAIWAKLKYRLYDKIIAISNAIKDVLIQEGVPHDKIITIKSATDIDEITTRCDKEWFLKEFELPENVFVIAMVAQFIERKGHRFLIEVAAELIDKHPEVRFLLFGRGPLEDEIKNKVRQKGIESFFRFCGFRDDLNRLYACFDLMVHPATMEGLGVSLIEASAAGVPIVAFNAGGIPEIINNGETGIVIDLKDKEGFIKAVLTLIENEKLRQKMTVASKNRVRQEFSKEQMVQQNFQLYKRLINRV